MDPRSVAPAASLDPASNGLHLVGRSTCGSPIRLEKERFESSVSRGQNRHDREHPEGIICSRQWIGVQIHREPCAPSATGIRDAGAPSPGSIPSPSILDKSDRRFNGPRMPGSPCHGNAAHTLASSVVASTPNVFPFAIRNLFVNFHSRCRMRQAGMIRGQYPKNRATSESDTPFRGDTHKNRK